MSVCGVLVCVCVCVCGGNRLDGRKGASCLWGGREVCSQTPSGVPFNVPCPSVYNGVSAVVLRQGGTVAMANQGQEPVLRLS